MVKTKLDRRTRVDAPRQTLSDCDPNSRGQAPLGPCRLHQFFEVRCDASPDALALDGELERLTYAELDARANQLAHHLTRRGVHPGDRVGLLLERSPLTYLALLAVLKCGAAFVPIDPTLPPERIAFIVKDASLRLLTTTTGLIPATAGVSCRVMALDAEAEAVAAGPRERLFVPLHGDALCYIIYTSGSTGRPKGVLVHHGSVCNFLSVCTPIYGVTSQDRVYQGMTIAFDFSIEEIWPTWVVGATLVVGPTDHRRLGSGLVDFLIEHRVTMLYCVPTLLATLDREIPALRILNVGGEACPHDLVRRWSRPDRRILNTYGPTETTVTATWAELSADRPVTIGRPLPTYRVYLLDESCQPALAGQPAEIYIGGPGVAKGYVNLPEMTANRFVRDPFTTDPGSRLYRTGDLGRLTPDGEIEYLGRIDSQVKIRGYRVELGEVEAILLEDEEASNAVVAIRTSESGVQELTAYLTLHDPARVDVADLKGQLHAKLSFRLPAYMVPTFIEILPALPMLPSGKADRSRLPAPVSARLGAQQGSSVPPATPLERELLGVWVTTFGADDISVEADFFRDLGGDSLLAALAVSKLRQRPQLGNLSIGDLYAHPTIRTLAQRLQDASSTASPSVPSGPRLRRQHGTLRVWACGAVQLALLYLLLMLALGVPVLLQARGASAGAQGLLSFGLLATVLTVFLPSLVVLGLLLPILLKWTLIGRFRPGRHPLWGWYYCRWWLVRKAISLAPLAYLAGSPLLAIYARLLGARIGKGCYLGTPRLGLPDLIEIEDGACLGYGASLESYLVEDGFLDLGPIRIGREAYVGSNAVIMLGGSVGNGAQVADQSLVARNQVIPEGETWAGSPSSRTANTDPVLASMKAEGRRQKAEGNALYSFCLHCGYIVGFLLLEMLPLLMFLPGLLLLVAASNNEPAWALALAPVAALLHVFGACLLIWAAKWLMMPSVRPGIYPIHSFFGMRKWFVDKLMLTSLGMTNTLYATLYAIPWLRMLGAKVGPRSEVSTVSHIDPDLLTLGPECFVADIAAVGPARYYQGQVVLARTVLGQRCFVGNAALIPCGRRLEDGSLIGVHSVPPDQPVSAGSSWLGSPAIFLPRRQESQKFEESLTYRPSASLIACRLSIEFLRVFLPPTFLYTAIVLLNWAYGQLRTLESWLLVLALLPGLYLSVGLLLTGVVAGLKWLIVGRYRPRVEPLWSNFVWRTELITGLYESVAAAWLLGWLVGTPLLPPLLRLFGARVGRRVYLDTTWMTEFDLVVVGDDAVIGEWTSLQTHLFEDRVMKMSTLVVGPRCTVGPRSVVLYDANLEAGCVLDALSLAMKGETLPGDSRWQGIPARRIQ
jgi:non-ribosomal peptide synthetase-like protein